MGESSFGDFSLPASRTRVHRQVRYTLLLVGAADLVVLITSVALAWDLRLTFDIWDSQAHSAASASLVSSAAPWVVAAWMVILLAQGAYSARLFGAGAEEFRTVLIASLFTAGAVGMFCYLIKLDLSRGFVLLTFSVGIPALLAERYAARQVVHRLRRRGNFLVHRVVAVGGPSGIGEVVSVLDRESYVGYRVVGACIPDGIVVEPDAVSVPVLGSVDKTRLACEQMGADTVLVARGGYATSADLRQIAWDLEGSDIDLVVVPSLTDVAGPRIHMRPVAGLPLLHLEPPQVDEAGGLAKRAFDIVVSLSVLVVVSPLMLALALLVKLHDGGPVFFRQPRVGRQSARFSMIKFRSMVTDAEQRLDEIEHLNESDGVLFKVKNDPRRTPVGRFLRRFSLDELPQLFNVLKGEMSLVGPRPPLPREVDTYGADVSRRLLVRPGMTGLWQVSGRSGLSWSESVRLDLYYVDNWSMTTDLVIMAKTIKAVLVSDGAY
jgi:exopolysaccharide biosynthesis polyprenyl glycosylphosphotransferase